jgi:excisionase family DNA binding protein
MSMGSKQEVGTAYLTVEEAAELAGLSHWTVRSWLHKGRLTRYKSASRTVVSRTELLALLQPKKTDPAKESARHRGSKGGAAPLQSLKCCLTERG